jgi:NADP-dependent 3-hydroxy acid dehydrogenase YdfG
MNMDLSNQVVIVTGGSKGFGAGIAEALKERGATVWISGRDQAALDATAKRLGVSACLADTGKGADWDRLIGEVTQQSGGRIDALINNAGGGGAIMPLAVQTDDDILSSININLTGALLGCRRVMPIMAKQNAGTIINVSSVCATYAWPGWSVYSAAKAGLVQASKCMQVELRQSKVRVTSVIPSWGATDFAATAGLTKHPMLKDPAVREQCIKPIELGRLIADIVALPAHLRIQDVTLIPLVQDIMPL